MFIGVSDGFVIFKPETTISCNKRALSFCAMQEMHRRKFTPIQKSNSFSAILRFIENMNRLFQCLGIYTRSAGMFFYYEEVISFWVAGS
jgi:hypothetical protein